MASDTTHEAFEKARRWVEDELEKWAAGAREKTIAVRTAVRTSE